MRTLTLSDQTIETLIELLEQEGEALHCVAAYGDRYRAVLCAKSELNAARAINDGAMSEADYREMTASCAVH